MTPADSFPRQSARTQRFTLGAPRDLTVSHDGLAITFLRSGGPEDPVTALWRLDLATGIEQLVADPVTLLAGDHPDLPPDERRRRERARESAAGITSYATDHEGRVATAPLAGQLVVADLVAGSARLLSVPGPVIDPRPDPTGTRAAWVHDRALWVADLADASTARRLVGDDDRAVAWGLAEFIAAEEMDRHRGYWWAPDGEALLVARVDESRVARWWIADPARPAQPPAEVAYPAAGTADAEVSAWIVDLAGRQVEVVWDRDQWPYLAAAGWDPHGPLIALHPRDQQAIEIRSVDPGSGATEVVWADQDACWVERLAGTPARLGDGRLVVGQDDDATRRLVVDGVAVTPDDLHVRGVSHVGDDYIVLTANPVHDASSIDVWRWSDGALERLTSGDGVHSAEAGGGVVVLRRRSLHGDGASFELWRADPPPAAGAADEATAVAEPPTLLRSLAAAPLVRPAVTIHHLGPRRLPTALLLPAGPVPERLPVLLDPYGGPHAQRVVRARDAYLTSQWFADQGFAVVVADGRGTPGRGSAWERAVRGDLAGPVLDDQLEALEELARVEPRLDLDRVAIRGWSFGGYLAALAVLRRPDAVHAAIAGAPVTDWRLYDTFYTERYLGHPDDHADAYERTSLINEAERLTRPLLLIHGLADDNVVAAHTLQLSAALLVHGRPHQVLPLTGVTHMASQEDVAENLLLLQLQFLRDALALT